MEITWLGHSTVRIELDGTVLLTDPALRPRLAGLVRHAPAPAVEARRHVDAVLISHAHHDHLDLPSLRLLGADIRIIVSRGAGAFLGRAGFRNVTEVEVGSQVRIDEVDVTAVPAQHLGRRMPFGPWAVAIGYRIDGSRSVYFAGDTALFDEMAQIGDGRPLDLALLPVGGWGPRLRGGHLDPPAAARALTLVRPRLALPIHWGTFWPAGMRRVGASRFSEPGNEFATHAARVAPDVEILRPVAGQRLTISEP